MRLNPDLVPDLVNGLCLKDYICAISHLYHLAKTSQFQRAYSQFTYRVSDVIRILSASRSNLERCLHSRGDPDVHPAAMQKSSTGPGLSTIYGVRRLTYSHICIPAGRLGHCARQLLATVLPSVSPKSNLSRMEPSGPPLVVTA